MRTFVYLFGARLPGPSVSESYSMEFNLNPLRLGGSLAECVMCDRVRGVLCADTHSGHVLLAYACERRRLPADIREASSGEATFFSHLRAHC
jgi:hypothetical protein